MKPSESLPETKKENITKEPESLSIKKEAAIIGGVGLGAGAAGVGFGALVSFFAFPPLGIALGVGGAIGCLAGVGGAEAYCLHKKNKETEDLKKKLIPQDLIAENNRETSNAKPNATQDEVKEDIKTLKEQIPKMMETMQTMQTMQMMQMMQMIQQNQRGRSPSRKRSESRSSGSSEAWSLVSSNAMTDLPSPPAVSSRTPSPSSSSSLFAAATAAAVALSQKPLDTDALAGVLKSRLDAASVKGSTPTP